MSNGVASNVASTVTGGIQEISALLPLLGTDQCEEHTGSALGNGYFYSGITPISIFGSLGIVKAGFNILVAGIVVPSRKFLGAQQLADGGFRPKGEVAQLIALDPKNPHRFLAESNLEAILENEHIENVEDLKIDWAEGSVQWNITMVIFTFAICTLGITPYIYIILRSKVPDNPLFLSGWAFPVARIVASAISGIFIQIILQLRILIIIKNRLLFITMDRYMNKRTEGLDQQHLKELKENLPNWSANRASEICLWELQAFLDSVKSKSPSHIGNALATITTGMGNIVPKKLSPAPNDATVMPNENPESPTIEEIKKSSPETNSADLKDHAVVGVEDEQAHAHDFTLFRRHWKETKKHHFPHLRFWGLSLENIIHTWTYFFLHLVLLLALIVSVVGYAGSFSLIQNSRQNAGPVLWLAFEVLLCFLRIAVWAWNPDLDDNKGVAFKITLASKSPLVTCNIYGDDLESMNIDVEAPVVRSKSFLEEIASYTGPLAAFRWSDTALYYMLTGSKYSEQQDVVDKALYIVISDFKEQTSRIVVKRTPEAGFTFLMSMLKPDPQSTVITVNAVYPSLSGAHKSNSGGTTPETHVLTADPDFMHRLSDHYDDILARINDIKHEEDRTFYANWALQHIDQAQSSPDADGTMQRQPKLTIADVAYLNQGRLHTRRDIYTKRLEKWVSDCWKLYARELLEQVPYASPHASMSKLEGIEVNEVENLIAEVRRQMEHLLLNTLKKWLVLVDKANDDMITNVIAFFNGTPSSAEGNRTMNDFSDTKLDSVTTTKLHSRLSEEKERSLSRTKLNDHERMQARIVNDRDLAHTRIQARKYLDPKEGKRIIRKWRRQLGLDAAWAEYSGPSNRKSIESSRSNVTIQSNSDTNTKYQDVMNKRLDDKARFLGSPEGESLRHRCQARVAQWQDTLKNHCDEFSKLADKEFLSNVTFSSHIFYAVRKYWSVQAMSQRLQLMDKHLKYLIVSDELVKDLGGFDNLALALKQSCVSILYFDCALNTPPTDEHPQIFKLEDDQHDRNAKIRARGDDDMDDETDGDSSADDFSATDIEDLSDAEAPPPGSLLPRILLGSTMSDIASSSRFITGIYFSDQSRRLSDHIQEIIEHNKDRILNAPGLQTVCEFDNAEITDNLRHNRPYVLFGRSQTSKCTIKFRVGEKVNHVLTLSQAFTTLGGEIDVKLNSRRLAKIKRSRQRITGDFYDESFDIPSSRLKPRPAVNIITITLLDRPWEQYYLSDIVITTTSSQQTGSPYYTPGNLVTEPEDIMTSSLQNNPSINISLPE